MNRCLASLATYLCLNQQIQRARSKQHLCLLAPLVGAQTIGALLLTTKTAMCFKCEGVSIGLALVTKVKASGSHKMKRMRERYTRYKVMSYEGDMVGEAQAV